MVNYLIIMHDGNGEIDKDGVLIKETTRKQIEDNAALDGRLVCYVPLSWISEAKP